MRNRLPIVLALCFASTSSLVRAADAGQIDYRAIAARHQGSLTSPLLRHDATARIRSGLTALDHCPDVVVKSMSVVRFASAADPWYERWIVADCKKTRVVNLEFTPTADGGADMHISLKN